MNEDEMIAQSAAEATALGKTTALDRSERDVSAAGLTTSSGNSGDMNEGRSYAGSGGGSGPGDVQAREFQANRQAVETRQQILNEGEMSMADLLSPDLASSDANARENARTMMRAEQMANRMINNGAQQVVHNAYMNPNEATQLMEQEAYIPAQSNDGWQVKKKFAKLKSGKQIPVFMVEDALTGMTTGKKYRISTVAEKIALVLNATQNMQDSRIIMIENSYEQHVELMRTLNAAKKSGNAQKVSIIESKLQLVNSRLGLS